MNEEELEYAKKVEEIDDKYLEMYGQKIEVIKEKLSEYMDKKRKVDRLIQIDGSEGICVQYKTDSPYLWDGTFHIRDLEILALKNGQHLARFQLHFMYNVKYREIVDAENEGRLVLESIWCIDLSKLRLIIKRIFYVENFNHIKDGEKKEFNNNKDFYMIKHSDDGDKWYFKVKEHEDGRYICIPFDLVDDLSEKWYGKN